MHAAESTTLNTGLEGLIRLIESTGQHAVQRNTIYTQFEPRTLKNLPQTRTPVAGDMMWDRTIGRVAFTNCDPLYYGLSESGGSSQPPVVAVRPRRQEDCLMAPIPSADSKYNDQLKLSGSSGSCRWGTSKRPTLRRQATRPYEGHRLSN